MEILSIFIGLFGAVGSLATAFFMYFEFRSRTICISASVSDVSEASLKGSKGEKLQKEGFFVLHVVIDHVPSAVHTRWIKVKGAKIPEEISSPRATVEKPMHTGRTPLKMLLLPNQSCQTIDLLIQPLNPESGELEVVVGYDLIRRAKATCEYHRSEYY